MATSKPKSPGVHHFGRPRLNQHRLAFQHSAPTQGSKFQPLPPPTGTSPYRLDLADVLPPDQIDAITKAKRLVFHTDGDLGGIKDAVPQERVAQGIEEDFLFATRRSQH